MQHCLEVSYAQIVLWNQCNLYQIRAHVFCSNCRADSKCVWKWRGHGRARATLKRRKLEGHMLYDFPDIHIEKSKS